MVSSSFHVDSLELASLLEINDRFRKEKVLNVRDVEFCQNLGSTFTAATESLLPCKKLIVVSLVAFQNLFAGFTKGVSFRHHYKYQLSFHFFGKPQVLNLKLCNFVLH